MKWLYAIRGYLPRGGLDGETVHSTESSKDVEIVAYMSRMNCGEVSHIEVTKLTSPFGTETIYANSEKK